MKDDFDLSDTFVRPLYLKYSAAQRRRIGDRENIGNTILLKHGLHLPNGNEVPSQVDSHRRPECVAFFDLPVPNVNRTACQGC